MVTSVRNNKLAVRLALDPRYKVQKNGTIKKKGADGKYRTLGTERHGYQVITYKGKKLVVGRIVYAQRLLNAGYGTKFVAKYLGSTVVERENGFSLDDHDNNLRGRSPGQVKREKTKRLTRKQIDRMVDLFCAGYSVAKIARRFRRKISRSHISRVIRKELGAGA
ncbi:MAG: hypothetical protein A4S09_05070 [Proteobacteria bacterium SG_bin7]|nr:MAG: hypothetical protein A4S09_05070 [Proteobacteria bacterium SG_bin7]